MSKYTPKVLALISKERIKSTHQILRELEEITKKAINWHMVYRILMELREEGKVKRLDSDAGMFWMKKE